MLKSGFLWQIHSAVAKKSYPSKEENVIAIAIGCAA
jgi:hypothetical protein